MHNNKHFITEDLELVHIYSHFSSLPSIIAFKSPKNTKTVKDLLKDYVLERTNVGETKEYRYISYLYKHPAELIFVKFSEEIPIENKDSKETEVIEDLLDEEEYEDLLDEECVEDFDNEEMGDLANEEHTGVVIYHGETDLSKVDIYNKLLAAPYPEVSPTNNLYLTAQGSNGSLYLREFNLKDKIEVDIDLNYNDDFKAIHELVSERIKGTDKGIIMFHGEPGTGKTSYIKWFLQNTPKKVIFLPPYLASQLASPHFINFISDSCKNSLLVIEDAEEVLRSRETFGNEAVSNLLNVTDGLLSDIFNIQILATFNCKISEIDDALKRKGRIIAEYEFKPLKKEKAQLLSDKLGFNSIIEKDTLLTDIFNQKELDFRNKERVRIGFAK